MHFKEFRDFLAFKNFSLSDIDNVKFAVDTDIEVLTESEYKTLYSPRDVSTPKKAGRSDNYEFVDLSLDEI